MGGRDSTAGSGGTPRAPVVPVPAGEDRQTLSMSAPGARRTGLLRPAAVVASLAAAGRTLGYARNVAAAAALGAGPVADAFLLAFRAATFLRGLFGGRGVGAAFVPMFARRLASAGPDPARAYAGQVLSLAAASLVVLVALLELAAPWLVRGLAPGFASEAGGGTEQLALTILLVRIMIPFVLLAALAQLLGGMLNGYGRFAVAAALPALFNATALAALLLAGGRLDTPAHALAWGVAAAGAVQLACAWLACRRAGLLPPTVRPRLSASVRRTLRRAGPATAGFGAVQTMTLMDLALASLLPTGAVSWLYYAERVAHLLPSVAGAAAATVLLPHLARRTAVAGDDHGATNRTVEAILLLGLPGAVALAVISGPAVAALFQRGAFGADATAATAAALAAYAGAVPAWMLARTLAAACFARGDTVTPMLAAFAAVALNLVLSRLLMEFWGHVGIALATSAAVWMLALALTAVLARSGGFAPDARLRRRAPAIAAASLVMAAALWAARRSLDGGTGAWELERIATLAALVTCGLAVFAPAAWIAGALSPGEIVRAWRDRS